MLSSVLGRCYFGDKGNLGFRGFVCSSPNRLTRLVCVWGGRGVMRRPRLTFVVDYTAECVRASSY